MISDVFQFKGLQYLVTYPNGYELGKKYPVLIFLHGAGSLWWECKDDNLSGERS